MDLGIKGRTALVCASTSGLGEATARAIAAEGARTVVCGRRGERAREIAADLPDAVGLQFDITTPDSGRQLMEDVRRSVGMPDILVLNGPGPRPSSATELTPQEISAELEPLLSFHVGLVHAALPSMMRRGWGRIVSIGSSGIVAPIADLAVSNLGRAALAGYLKTLAAEVAAHGVTVNLVLPGRIATQRTAAIDAARAERNRTSAEDVSRRSKSSIPMGRYGTPSEFAAAATFLCSDQASYITGAILRCDGGLVQSL